MGKRPKQRKFLSGKGNFKPPKGQNPDQKRFLTLVEKKEVGKGFLNPYHTSLTIPWLGNKEVPLLKKGFEGPGEEPS